MTIHFFYRSQIYSYILQMSNPMSTCIHFANNKPPQLPTSVYLGRRTSSPTEWRQFDGSFKCQQIAPGASSRKGNRTLSGVFALTAAQHVYKLLEVARGYIMMHQIACRELEQCADVSRRRSHVELRVHDWGTWKVPMKSSFMGMLYVQKSTPGEVRVLATSFVLIRMHALNHIEISKR